MQAQSAKETVSQLQPEHSRHCKTGQFCLFLKLALQMSRWTGKDAIGGKNSPLDLKNIGENCPRGKLQMFIKDSTYLGKRICTLKSQS